MSATPDPLSLAFFSAQAGAAFGVAGCDGVTLVLAQVNPGGMPGYLRPECFSLIFEGPAQPRLEQATYQLRGAAGEGFGIFLVPVGAGAGVTRYEAIFN